MVKRCFVSIILFCFASSVAGQDTTEHIILNRLNSKKQQKKPYIILISADGFRHDYLTKYNAANLLRFSKNGVRAESMIPSYPSVTYPNHYSVATGMYPSHHGIVYNSFYDRKRKQSYSISDRSAVEDGTWWGGIPLWVLAEQQGMVTAAYGYVGTEAAIQDTYSTYWYRYNKKTTVEKGLAAVERWLNLPGDVRPHLGFKRNKRCGFVHR
jgi:predicted AlkP superfamily pyrophosphatase or phosphodiesterase